VSNDKEIDYSKPIDDSEFVEHDPEVYDEIPADVDEADAKPESAETEVNHDSVMPTGAETRQSNNSGTAPNPFAEQDLRLTKDFYDLDAIKAKLAGGPPKNSARAGKCKDNSFAMVHEAFWEPLSRAESPTTLVVFFFVLREWWLKKEPVTVSNTALSFISRKRKYRAIADLERLGVVAVEREGKKSPRVTPLRPQRKITTDG
jgi:hypothetical protein